MNEKANEYAREIDDLLNNISGYDDLKKALEKVGDKVQEWSDNATEKAGEWISEIPDTLVCD